MKEEERGGGKGAEEGGCGDREKREKDTGWRRDGRGVEKSRSRPWGGEKSVRGWRKVGLGTGEPKSWA